MQCPPTPGPGQNGMKPYGLVDAAPIASHRSTSRSLDRKASSFTSAMFTLRNVFSISLAISASRGVETSSTSWMKDR